MAGGVLGGVAILLFWVTFGRSGSTSTPSRQASTHVAPGVYAAGETGELSPRVAGIPEWVYVPNTKSDTVSVIDPKTYKIVSQFPVGRYSQHITPSWDLRSLYVNNTLNNSLTVIDPRTAKPVRTLSVPNPYNLYFTPDGSKAIVVAESLGRLDFRDPHTFKLIKSVPIPVSGPNHLDFSADGRTMLISTEFSGYAVRVDIPAMKVTGMLHVGGQPIDVKLSPDGKVFYMANVRRGGVSVIDPNRMKEIALIPTARGAHGLTISRDGFSMYVANRASGSISVIDLATRKVVKTWQVAGSPDMMQVTPDGRWLWYSNRFHGTVSVLDTTTGRVLHTIPTGESPHGLTLFPNAGRFSLGHNGVYR